MKDCVCRSQTFLINVRYFFTLLMSLHNIIYWSSHASIVTWELHRGNYSYNKQLSISFIFDIIFFIFLFVLVVDFLICRTFICWSAEKQKWNRILLTLSLCFLTYFVCLAIKISLCHRELKPNIWNQKFSKSEVLRSWYFDRKTKFFDLTLKNMVFQFQNLPFDF